MGVHRTPVKHIRKIIFILFPIPDWLPTSRPCPAKASMGATDQCHIFVRLRFQRRSASAL